MRIAAVDARGDAAELLLRVPQLAHRDREQPVGAERDALVEPELLLELLPPEPERALAARREVALEIVDVAADRGGRLGRRVGEIAEQVQIVEIAERARQILVDEPQRAAHALEADLDEDAGRILDVVARRLHQPRHLPQLRQHAAGALGERRVVEQRLAGQAGRQDVGVVLGAALPGPDLLELEQPRADVRVERRPLEPLDVGQPRRDRWRRAAGRSRRGRGSARRSPDGPVLEQVVVQMDAVERGVGGMDLVEIREVLVDEVRQGFG